MSEIGGIKDRLTLVTAGAYFDDTRSEYDANGNLIFEGLALVHKTSTSDEDWYIWKYTYDADNRRIREEGPLEGSWDNRDALAWGTSGRSIFKVFDVNSTRNDLLMEILNQLKIMNIHFSILNNEEITEGDID